MYFRRVPGAPRPEAKSGRSGVQLMTRSDLETDSALPVLRRASNADLSIIVDFLANAFDVSIKQDPRYREASENLTSIPDVIDEHLRRAGGNAISNFIRGAEGPQYIEVVRDVCEAMKVNFGDLHSVPGMEERLLHSVAEPVWAEMIPEDRTKILTSVGEFMRQDGAASVPSIAGMGDIPFSALVSQIGPRAAGFLTTQVVLQVVNSLAHQTLGRGWDFAKSAALSQGIGLLLGPIGVAMTSIWTVVSVAGPSLKATTPAVLQIAVMRQSLMLEEAMA
jgi:uncharacterized protein YaaW (UPF0174 family)